MPYRLSLNTGPSLQRVVIIALLLFGEAVCISLGLIFSQQRMPTQYEYGGILTTAFVQLITYTLGFLKKEES